MIRILLLDCSRHLESRLKDQGFDVESGTAGFCTGVRRLPSQVYEKDIVVYNPIEISLDGGIIYEQMIEDETPEYSLEYLTATIDRGATVVVFLNRLSGNLEAQRIPYRWIPYMPPLDFTSDKLVHANPFESYPDSEWKLLSPIVSIRDLALPVLQKVFSPEPQP
ncbi:MAG TPA: hypothetical protein VKS44_17575 [Candidatus Acidoferrales bacterium]|nr:hypothetical protein [Candidatus Acidoferrales bacterium]